MRLGVLSLTTALFSFTNALEKTLVSSDRTFDYVVVGGGTAGLVIAARLTEDPDTSVAVVEAGVHHVNEPLVDTPEFFSRAIGNPAFDWNFVTVPQPALNNAVKTQPRGKMLGGSSGLNFIVWDRASQKEYDAWETLGATGWNWNSLLPYFKKSETIAPQSRDQIIPGALQVSETNFDSFHGRSGPVQPSYNVFQSNITDPYVDTINSLGIRTNSDPYTGDATGIYNPEVSIDRVKNVGRRSYSASTYFNISADRPNLTVFLSTQATKINLERGDDLLSVMLSLLRGFLGLPSLRATSVDVVAVNNTGITGTISARKEVVVSAGAFKTPHLLELSGIGNKEILQKAGIESVIDLPGVGENFQDHPSFAQDFEVVNTLVTYDMLRNNATFLAEQQALFTDNGTGMLASAQFVLAFSPLPSILSPQLLVSVQEKASAITNSPGLSPLTRMQHEIELAWLTESDVANIEFIMITGGGRLTTPPAPGSEYITLYSCLMHPFSRGTVHLNSSDPLVQPLINPNYLDNDVDMELALQGVKLTRNFTRSQPLDSFVIGEHDPPANVTSDADFTNFIKTFLRTTYHPIGTAPMLPREIGGVVDPRTLKVYGTSNLRVVDASLMPMLIATHPQSTVYAIAERAFDMIKGVL